MSKNILIAQVGSGKYKSIEYTVFTGCNEEHSVYYADDGGSPQEASIEAKFSFYAIYQKLRLSGRVDALVLVGTKTSSWYTLCENMKEISGAEGEIRLSDLTDGMDGKNPCISNIENPTKREKTEDFLSQCLNGSKACDSGVWHPAG